MPILRGGVFATSSASPAGVKPLNNPTTQNSAANHNADGANGTSAIAQPMPSIARSTMILRP